MQFNPCLRFKNALITGWGQCIFLVLPKHVYKDSIKITLTKGVEFFKPINSIFCILEMRNPKNVALYCTR